MRPDPIELGAVINLFAYVGNNPLRCADVYGLDPLVNVITGYGPQFGFTLLFLRAEIDLGSQKYDFMTGKDIVTESYGAGLLMGKKVILGVHAER